jgi:hypothetical protein
MITPQIGMVVWYYPQGIEGVHRAGIIADVLNEHRINIAWFGGMGVAKTAIDVELCQDEMTTGPVCTFPNQE